MSKIGFNLLRESWLPVRRRSGERGFARPSRVTDGLGSENEIIAFDWGRADLDAACLELMIGLVSTACPATILSGADWRQWWKEPPTADELDAAFAPLVHAFNLDGDRPRFMQDLELREGSEENVGALLIDNPGENTVKKNTDLFVRRGRIDVLSRGAAAMTIYQLQTFAPSGGAGHRTGLRGGGPVTCTVLSDRDEERALWHRIWLNAHATREWLEAATGEKPIFPWLVPTRVSDKGRNTTPVHTHPACVLWGMPRRIRLELRDNTDRRPCALTGVIDDVVVETYVTRPHGNKYEAFGLRHPLTPHYRQKAGDAEWLPLHPQPGNPGYGDWIGLVIEDKDELRMPPAIVEVANERLDRLGHAGLARLHIAGFDMDNMKARGFVEHELPFTVLPEEDRKEVDLALGRLIRAAREVESILGYAVALTLGEMKRDQGQRWIAGERFWAETEPAFLTLAAGLPHRLRDEKRKTRWWRASGSTRSLVRRAGSSTRPCRR